MKSTLHLLLFYFFAIFSPFSLLAQIKGDISYMTSGGKLNPLQALMDVRHYTLALEVDIPNQQIAGYVEVDVILSKATDSLLFDLYKGYKVSSIEVDHNGWYFKKVVQF